MRSPDARHWILDPGIDYLNHGGFGAAPRPVLDAQAAWRERLERGPARFFDHDLEGLLADVREELGAFVGASPDELAFVVNATTGVNTVLHALRFEPGDELLTTDHDYNATINALRRVAARDGARVVVARIPFPVASPDEAVEAIVRAVTPRTRLLLMSHISSATAVVLPVERIVRELGDRDVDTLLDAAHAPGQVPLHLGAIGAAYATGNAHKWLCAPKGAAFLHVRADRQDRIRPLVVSHGANDRRSDRTRFRAEFDWVGTADPTAVLAIPAALAFMGSLRPGGWPALMAANHELALRARDLLCQALGQPRPAPDAMTGAMTAVPLPDDVPPDVRDRLYDEHRIEVPIPDWPVDAALEPGEASHARLVRVSAQAYNDLGQMERLAAALRSMRGAGARPRAGADQSASTADVPGPGHTATAE